MSTEFLCEYCANIVEANDKKCNSCGLSFADILCPECGHKGNIILFQNGCPTCGHTSITRLTKPKKKPINVMKSTLMIFGFSLFFMILLLRNYL